jgi:8-oxo-dGTP pyrophosphatase MutT (NUDIX family)
MHHFLNFLESRLKEELPGRHAQLKMAPEPVSSGKPRRMEAPEDASQSSVLVLLFPNEENELELILTLRSDDINHGGQLSFPGGRAEKNESIIATALREAQEEIDIKPEKVKVIGYLSELFVAHSNNRVAPVVGFLSERPEFKINPAEVEEVFAVELDSLLHKKNLLIEEWDLQTYTYRVPYWNVHRVPLWGATAMMLSELLDLYREFLGK